MNKECSEEDFSEIPSFHSECFFCDFIEKNNRLFKTDLDLFIFQKVGSATYTQLCEHFPGYYNEKYCEYRNNGDTLSYTHFFNPFLSRDEFLYKNGYDLSSKRNGLPFQSTKCFEIENGEFTFDDCVPPPPNFVSGYVVENLHKKPCEIKYFLVKELKKCENELLESSQTYNKQEFKYSDIVLLSIIVSVIATVFIGYFISKS